MLTNLLWKDLRQVFPSVAVCLGLAVLGQVLFISRWLRNEDFFELDIPRSLAMVGPLIVALACAGMIFGNERQSRTSHWLSTLPVHWYQSAISQFLIASVCIVVTAIVTHCIARFAPVVVHDPLWRFFYSNRLFEVILFAGLLFVLSIIGTLLWEETLYGLCAAGIAFVSMNALVGYSIENTLSYIGWDSAQWKYDAVFYPSLAALAVLMLVVSVSVYRWRWTLGQFVDSWRSIQQRFFGPWRSDAEALAGSIPRRARDIPAAYPNQPFRTLLGQSMRQAPYLRIALVLAPWAIALTDNPREFQNAVASYSLFSFLILGLSCFVADHSKLRFRFLADRGVPAWKFYWARTLPLLGIVILMTTAALTIAGWLFFVPEQFHVIQTFTEAILFYQFSITFFFAGQLASLCFRNALISISAVLAAGFAMLCVFSLFNQNSLRGYSIFPFTVLQATVFVSTIAMIAAYLIIAVFGLVPTWTRVDRPERRLAGGFIVSGIFVPLLLLHAIAIVGYWMIPPPMWVSEMLSPTELAASQPKSHDVSFALKSRDDLFKTCGFPNSPLVKSYSTNGSFDDESFDMNGIQAMTLDDAKVATAIEWVTELNADLDRCLASLETTSAANFEIKWHDLRSLQHDSASCAAMSRLAISQRERELLEACFNSLQKMQALYPWIDPVSRIALHRRVLTVLSTCSDDDLKWIAKSYSIKPMLTEVTSLAQYRRWVIERSLFVEKRPFSELTQAIDPDDWEELNRYRWRGTMNFRASPTWYTALPQAIAKREYLYTLAREVRAELEMLDHLVELESQAGSPKYSPNSESISMSPFRLGPPPYEMGFHLREWLRYRELEQSVTRRVLAKDIQ